MKIDFSELVNQLYEKREYRPVGVAVLHKENVSNREYLVVQSAKDLNQWYFPQGGVELGENLEENLSREVKEELGVDFISDVTGINPAYHYEVLNAESTRKDKRGFTKGKAYIFTLGQYVGDSEFVLQKDEINEVKWADYDEALRLFNLGRQAKASLSKRALNKAIDILEK